jgi:hypothetical protein
MILILFPAERQSTPRRRRKQCESNAGPRSSEWNGKHSSAPCFIRVGRRASEMSGMRQ